MEQELIEDTNIISPYEEIISYETLWAQPGMTEKKMTELFLTYGVLPSKVLQNQLSFLPEDAALRTDVKRFIDKKIGTFNVCIHGDFQYPEGLRKAQHPIEMFYYRGNLDLLTTRSVSIVGARKVSSEGLQRTKRLSKELSGSGFTIVSGLAYGVDTEAHKTALLADGITIGVIGTPIDAYYPKENMELQDRIARDYLLISQVPFYRYEHESFPNHKFYFPRRNVTMAAISEATIIVEASDTSGSLTQARACIQQGKKLFILDSCFQKKDISWPKTYEAKGAIRVKTTEDILDHLQSQEL
ncbi:MAG: DNA-protecting protein DprA [Bdellovibrio sp.]|nr:DNA-protecting protein DprA [Bdellovibrio sp.]